MDLKPFEEALIAKSFAQLTEDSELAARTFYGRVFELAPELEAFFKDTNMHLQGRMFFEIIGSAVEKLHFFDETAVDLEALGKRHIRYGVKPEHYDIFGEALMWTFEQILGEDFTSTVRQAWQKIYVAIVANALHGSRDGSD